MCDFLDSAAAAVSRIGCASCLGGVPDVTEYSRVPTSGGRKTGQKNADKRGGGHFVRDSRRTRLPPMTSPGPTWSKPENHQTESTSETAFRSVSTSEVVNEETFWRSRGADQTSSAAARECARAQVGLTAVRRLTPPTHTAWVSTLTASATHTAGIGACRTRSMPNRLSSHDGSRKDVEEEG
jgi:hypothetical protein